MMHGIPQVDDTHHRSRRAGGTADPAYQIVHRVRRQADWGTGYTHQVQYTTDPGSRIPQADGTTDPTQHIGTSSWHL